MLHLDTMFANMTYAMFGVLIAIFAMFLGYKLFEKITPFNTGKELDDGNIAVGIVIGSIFIGVGLVVGLVVGISFV